MGRGIASPQFVAAFLAAALLRLIRLGENPAIHPDEASQLDVSYALFHGDFTAGLFTSSFLPRLPLPLALMHLAADAVGWNLYAIRACTVAAALLALVVMYVLLSRDESSDFRFLPCLVLAVYSPAVFFSRWGFTYNFLAPAFLYVIYQGIEYRKNSRVSDLYKMALGIAAALLSEPLGIVALIYGLLICADRGIGAIGRVLPTAVAPLCGYLLLLHLLIPDVLASDVRGILESRIPNQPFRISAVFVSLEFLFQVFGWPFALGLVGLWFAPRDVRRHALLFFAIFLLVSAQVAGGVQTLLIRQLIAVLPLQCLGIGCLLTAFALRVEKAISRLATPGPPLPASGGPEMRMAPDRPRRISAGLVRGAIASALLFASYSTARTVWSGHFRTPFDHLTVPFPAMDAAAEFLNAECEASDWVLAQSLPRRLNCRTGTLSQLAVVEGWDGNPFFPREIYQNRVVEPVTLGGIRYVVISPFTLNVETRYPGVQNLLEQTRRWPVVFRRAGVLIRESDRRSGHR